MFDIGFSELLLIAVVALVVLGPERLPKAARFAGLWVRRARAQWYSVRAELENELADEELRRSLKATQDELRAARAEMQAHGQALRAEIDAADGEIRAGLSAVTRLPPTARTLAGAVGRHVGDDPSVAQLAPDGVDATAAHGSTPDAPAGAGLDPPAAAPDRTAP